MMVRMILHVWRSVLLGAGLVALSGCVIVSKEALHSEAQKVPIETLMVEQSASFRSKAGDYVFLRRVNGQMTVALTKFEGAIGREERFTTALYRMDGLPSSVYVAVRSGVRSGEWRHEYVPFYQDASGILILSPRTRVTVQSMAEFQQALLNIRGSPVFYERLGRREGAAAYAQYQTRQVRRAEAAKRRAHEHVNPYRVFDTGIERFAVGDQVYWLREDRTDVMSVREVNISTGYLMVRRETDFKMAKVHHSHLMTGKQASRNGIKHGVATARSAFCLARPSDCSW